MSAFGPNRNASDSHNLREEEKSAILDRVRAFMRLNPLPTVGDVRAMFYAFAHRMTLRASFALIIIVLISRFGAEADAAVPGDALYPLKIHVIEVIRSAVSISDGDRAAWEGHRLQRRLDEAHALAERNKLDEQTTPAVIDTFERQAEAVDVAVAAATERGDFRSTAAIRQRLVRAIREREREFQRLTNRKDAQDDVGVLIGRLREARLRLLQSGTQGLEGHSGSYLHNTNHKKQL